MLYIADAKFLWLLLLVPAVLIIYGISRHLRNNAVRRFGDPALVRQLMPSWSSAKGWWHVVLFCLAFFFFVIGLSRPLIGAKLSERETRGAEIMICLDVSNSMLAQDYQPDRLSRAKLAISRLVDRLHDDRIGLVIFAGTSFVQLPVTADYISAKMFLGEVDTGSIPIQGTAIGDAIITAARGFSPQSEKSRAIIVISDGENHEDDAVEAAKTVADSGIKVYTIGVGSAEGEPIPMGGDLLKEIAAAGGGSYVHAGNQEFGLNPIIDEISMMEDERLSSIVFEEYDELYMYFLGIALGIFVIEMLIGERRAKRRIFR